MNKNANMIAKMQDYFNEYDQLFFHGKLAGVKLELSDKMKTSAGIFYKPRNQQNIARIRLNQPMLSTRSDKEILETLLHEMTHAYLFFTNKSAKPHGKEFLEKIREINKGLSLNITIRHDYVIWYRCNGKCRDLESCLFGYVSRTPTESENLDPLKRHQTECGGVFGEVDKPSKDMLKVIMNRYKLIKKSTKKIASRQNTGGFCITFKAKTVNPKTFDYASSGDEP